MGFYDFHEYSPMDQILDFARRNMEELKKHKPGLDDKTISGTVTINLADGVSIKRLFGNGVTPEPEQEPQQEPQHPDYYKGDNEDGKAIEVFDVIDQFVGGDFYLGNVLKYVCRAGKKSKETKKQDLEKALHYIKEAIKRV